MEDKNFSQSLKESIKKIFPKTKISEENKASGYKSIHYLATIRRGDKDFIIELQLRTLFQDIWAELDHTLSYKKGTVNQQIVDSFKILANELENNDNLIRNLKNISINESLIHNFLLENKSPYSYFGYDEYLIPQIFSISGVKKDKFEEYLKKSSDFKSRLADKQGWLEKSKLCLNELHDSLDSKDFNEENVNYFFDMENAYFFFCSGDYSYEDILKRYKELDQHYSDRYVIHFRLGEIYLISGEIDKALAEFDISENILIELQKITKINYINLYFIKVNLSFTYLSLDKKFIDYSLEKIYEAKEIFNSIGKKSFPENSQISLTNNLCYYNLEKYIMLNQELNLISKKSKEYSKIKNERDVVFKTLEFEFTDFEKNLGDKDLPSNFYDTAAWFYFNKFLKTNDYSLYKRAKEFCSKIYFSEINYSPLIIESVSLQLKHIEQILSYENTI